MNNVEKWNRLRHLVLQENAIYMKNLRKDKNTPEAQIINHFISKGFEHRKHWLERLIVKSRSYKKTFEFEDLYIAASS